MVEIDTLFQTKTAKKTIPFGAVHKYIAYIREYPRAKNALQIMSLAAYASEAKKTWTGINEVLFRRKKKLKTFTTIKDPNNKIKLIKDSSHNLVNEQFASVGSKLASKIPSSQQHFLDFANINMSPMPPFFFQPITYDCVKTRILSLVNDKSHGLYSSPTCPTKLLKCSIDIIAPILSELFYISRIFLLA